MPVSAGGQVEHQKLNQTTALLLFGWVFDVQLDSLEKSVLAHDEKRVDFIPTYCTTYTVFRAKRVTFFLVNRVEDPKLNQKTPYGAI